MKIHRLLVPLLLLGLHSSVLAQSFQVSGDTFLLNGKPFQILSGEMHYARIPREYWRDRLVKARAMGLNTICTYVFWNEHEQEEGNFDWSQSIAGFIREAQLEHLYVIVRPGPYVCAEWDFGGLPAWLLKDDSLHVRCSDRRFLEATRKYLNELARQITPLQITRGGPVIMIQLENEYGSFGSDKNYLASLRAMLRDAGFDVPLYTSDGPSRDFLVAGTLDDVPAAINFDSEPQKAFAVLEEFRPGTPPMSGEFWVGWFTHWGDKTWGTQDDARQLRDIEWMVHSGKSVNLYMFHGGTNFGFRAGANFSDRYEPTVTSYDYDAPLDEAGHPRPKYFALRKILAEAPGRRDSIPDLPPDLPTTNIPQIKVRESAPLFTNLPSPVPSLLPAPMEKFGQNYGYILYRTHITGRRHGTLNVHELHDRASVFLDGKFVGLLERSRPSIELPTPRSENGTLDILVEAYGRVNFGPLLIDRKGITDFAAIGSFTLMNWEVYPLPLDQKYLLSLKFREEDTGDFPAFRRGTFSLDQTGDTYLNMRGWKRGVVWINGHNLGRYWDIGPQHDLFVPGVWLKRGENTIVVFDMERRTSAELNATKERIRP